MYPIGTKVIVQDDFPDIHFASQTGKIIEIASQLPMYGIEFDKYIDGHTCNGRGKPGHCWWVHKKYVKPINKNQQMYFKMLEEVM